MSRTTTTPTGPLGELVLDLDEILRDSHGLREVDIEIPPPWLAGAMAAAQTDVEVDAPGAIAFEVSIQTDETVLVRGRLNLAYLVPCARCLAPSTVDAGTDLCVTYVPAARMREWLDVAQSKHGEDEEGIPLEADDLDQIPYEGRSLDLRPLVTEQALLAYPMRQLCSEGEACRGLCAGCGFALNGAPEDAVRCPQCERPLVPEADGADDAEADTPWKRALAGLKSSGRDPSGTASGEED